MDHGSDCTCCYQQRFELFKITNEKWIGALPEYMQDAIFGMDGAENCFKEGMEHQNWTDNDYKATITDIYNSLKKAKFNPRKHCLEILGDGVFVDGKRI